MLQLVPAHELHAQARWQKFISPDGDFTINFPAKPAYDSADDADRRIVRFSLTVNDHYLEVQYQDLPLRVVTREQLAASLEGVKSSYLRNVGKSGGKLIRLRELPEGGYQFDTVVPLHDGTPAHGRTRVYVRGKRQYTISCNTWNEDGLDESIASRFLDSFRFLNTSPGKSAGEKLQ
jgi:hypothetical protein